MPGIRSLRRTVAAGTVLVLVLLWCADCLLARGSMSPTWSPPGYNVYRNVWRFATPWGALMGAGIPHHSLEPPRFNASPATSFSGFSSGASAGSSNPIVRNQSSSFSMTPRVQYVYTQPPAYGGTNAPAETSPEGTIDAAYDPPYYHNYNDYWHKGYWGGGLWGWARWGGELGLWSFPRWWLGYLYYASGYGTYENPFEKTAGPRQPPQPFLDYSRPVQVSRRLAPSGASATAQPTLDSTRNQLVKTPDESEGLKRFDVARDAFKARDYSQALSQIEAALRKLPRDPAIHEFRALVLFAQGNYQPAASALYAVLSVSPGWNWPTLSSLYADADEYGKQLRALETYRKQNANSAEATFLLAYHYVTCSHYDAASRHLRSLTKLLPEDQFAPALLRLISGAVEEPAEPSATDATDDRADSNPIPPTDSPALDASKLVGTWKAERNQATTIQLTLKDDGTFEWSAVVTAGARRLRGTYSVHDNLMIMEEGGSPLIGIVTLRDQGGFNFRLIGSDPNDKGLEFTK